MRLLPGRCAEALIYPFDAGGNTQAFGLLRIVARVFGQLAAQEVQAGVELGATLNRDRR